jgi:hypothetical protein
MQSTAKSAANTITLRVATLIIGAHFIFTATLLFAIGFATFSLGRTPQQHQRPLYCLRKSK